MAAGNGEMKSAAAASGGVSASRKISAGVARQHKITSAKHGGRNRAWHRVDAPRVLAQHRIARRRNSDAHIFARNGSLRGAAHKAAQHHASNVAQRNGAWRHRGFSEISAMAAAKMKA
jgi:hypothetical protein